MAVLKERFRRPSQSEAGVRIHPVFDDFHLLRMEGDYEYPGHVHSNYELILVERGPYRCTLNGAELQVENGRVLVIKPGDHHQDHLRDGQRHYVLHFRLVSDARGANTVELFSPRVTPLQQVCRGNHARDALLLRELRREAVDHAAYAPAVQDCLLEALFWRTVRDLPPQGLVDVIRRLPKEEAIREQIVALMTRHLKDNPLLSELAAQLAVSPRHLTSRCKILFGVSPARLFMRLKMQQAEFLLRSRAYRIKEVSDELGFANPYHFSRVFRRHFGRPPSQV
ncbi:MAG TPA: AraC family transcriptional regulator [Opitutus sp.]|nr:AraC family transcriptional regulator [Opitutus sp.]